MSLSESGARSAETVAEMQLQLPLAIEDLDAYPSKRVVIHHSLDLA